MADPITAGIAGISAIGSIMGGNAADKAGAFNADMNLRNSTQSILQGQENVRRIKRSNKQFEGSQKAAIGASGLQLSGSALNVLSDSAIEGTLMALDAKVAAENQAKGFRNQAMLDRQRGKSAKRAGYLNAGTSLLKAFA